MKNRLTLVLFFVSFVHILFAQEKAYFQQEVDYKIDVTLNDLRHEVFGDIEIEYKNNSADELTEIYMHLWPNAYQNGTALAKQFLNNKETEMYYADADELGKITNLDFKVNNSKVEWKYDIDHKDIAILKLKTPLKSGESLTISTPFLVDIPASFSRLGHVGDSYQMTQWYPKPAVYDRFGWHPMPYLNFGEFFSEYGNFDVKITLPKNYVVGATGVLQNEEEKAFLMEKVKMTNQVIADSSFGRSVKNDSFPPSSSELKIIQYKAERVHDFAWFADKRFYVQKSDVTLASGQKVDTWAMFTNYQAEMWTKAVEYVNRSVLYYSERVGEYPYPHATAVQSALSAGGGMEYPMITVIGPSGSGKALDNVITHEVGHNWFYGILGSNERDYPWMDEGMNSYYEGDYMSKYYGEGGLDLGIPNGVLKFLDAEDLDEMQLMYLWQARQMKNQPMNTTSGDLTMINYQLSAYSTPAAMLKYLEKYLGTAEYDRIMQLYYTNWKFRHPYPSDVEALFEKETGKDLDWFFGDFFNTRETIDYSLKNVKVENGKANITLRNRSDIKAPVVVSVYTNDSTVINNYWFDGFAGEKIVEIDAVDGAKYMIDAENSMLEINRQNNYEKTPTKLKFLVGLENDKKRTLYVAPTLGYNNYDGFMLGLGFYNRVFPAKKFEFAFTPMYGFNSGTAVGLGDFKYHFYSEDGFFRRVTIGLSGRSFNEFESETFDYFERYNLIKPSLEFEFNRSDISPTKQRIILNYKNIQNENASLGGDGVVKTINVRNIFEGRYELNRNTAFDKSSIEFSVLGEQYQKLNNVDVTYVRTTVEATHSFKYRKNKRKSFDVRLFAGAFLFHDDKQFGAYPLTLTSQGFNDWYYDDFYFGRSEYEGFLSNQINLGNGGFKVPVYNRPGNVPPTIDRTDTDYGESNNFLLTMNFKADLPMKLPLKLPIKPYLDIGLVDQFGDLEFVYNAGVALDFFDGILGIYVPLIGTEELMNQQTSFGSRISFNLDLQKLNGFEALRNLSIN